eukprot:scaffold41098_cov54-Phaeocystis_antarctica.AAC.3
MFALVEILEKQGTRGPLSRGGGIAVAKDDLYFGFTSCTGYIQADATLGSRGSGLTVRHIYTGPTPLDRGSGLGAGYEQVSASQQPHPPRPHHGPASRVGVVVAEVVVQSRTSCKDCKSSCTFSRRRRCCRRSYCKAVRLYGTVCGWRSHGHTGRFVVVNRSRWWSVGGRVLLLLVLPCYSLVLLPCYGRN